MKYYKQGDKRFSAVNDKGFIQVFHRTTYSTIRMGFNPFYINDIEQYDKECTKEEFEAEYQKAAAIAIDVIGI